MRQRNNGISNGILKFYVKIDDPDVLFYLKIDLKQIMTRAHQLIHLPMVGTVYLQGIGIYLIVYHFAMRIKDLTRPIKTFS